MFVLQSGIFTSQDRNGNFQKKNDTRCAFLIKQGFHLLGMWQYECSCGASPNPSSSCWKDNYEWRRIPRCCFAYSLENQALLSVNSMGHALPAFVKGEHAGPDEELHQFRAFGEPYALFPRVEVHIDFVGPEIPQERDGERIECTYLLVNRSSRFDCCPKCWHCCLQKLVAAIELLNEMKVAVIFSDFCKETSRLASNCISNVTGSSLAILVHGVSLEDTRPKSGCDNHWGKAK